MLEQLPDLDGSAGAAFQLRKPAKSTFTIEHEEGTVSTQKDSLYIVVKMRTEVTESELRDHAWRIIQESLDIRAAMHREALSTYRGDHEYALWTLGSSGYTLVIVDVSDLKWGVTARSESKSCDATAPSPAPEPVAYHPALRFYRLSQLSEDLFDAYRNAYLSLECIVNKVSPKEKEKEDEWLKRVLSGPLKNAIPSELVDCGIDGLFEEIYTNGRLPLFHAKKDFYTSQGPERDDIQSRLTKLHRLLASIMNHEISPLIPCSGWGEKGQGVIDSEMAILLDVDEVVYSLGSQQETREISVEVVDAPRRHGNIWGRVTTSAPKTLSALELITFRKKGTEMTTKLELPQQIPLRNVSSIRVELNQLVSNEKAPNPLHPA